MTWLAENWQYLLAIALMTAAVYFATGIEIAPKDSDEGGFLP